MCVGTDVRESGASSQLQKAEEIVSWMNGAAGDSLSPLITDPVAPSPSASEPGRARFRVVLRAPAGLDPGACPGSWQQNAVRSRRDHWPRGPRSCSTILRVCGSRAQASTRAHSSARLVAAGGGPAVPLLLLPQGAATSSCWES